MNMTAQDAQKQNPEKTPLQRRLDRMGAACMEKAPGTGETVRTIFQGVSLLAQDSYPLWQLENTLTPRLKRHLRPKDACYESLIFQAMDLAENVSRSRDQVRDQERREGYRLLYELMIAPFCYLERTLAAREGRALPEDFRAAENAPDGDEWGSWD